MPIDLTSYILPQFNVLGRIPQEALSEIRNQSASGEVQIRLGGLMVSIRPISDRYFGGTVTQGNLSENDLQIALNHIENIERSLNHGLSSRDVEIFRGIEMQNNNSIFYKNQSGSVLDKVELCAFYVENAELSAPESSRTCPVTLCEPEIGVFMKNSLSSDVCTLYDKTALINLIDMKAPHPLSRETITASMIIGKDECYFVPDRESFILKES
ncbi:T3SS effector NleG family protein [Escherichia albertii]|uniref:T3SS effector NleG family protein n=1 Tax=Escherichia albertii TaxID=208962 RepID=UPI0010F9262C|nr:T3SS effector NleG family protein [Escherichia albertii]